MDSRIWRMAADAIIKKNLEERQASPARDRQNGQFVARKRSSRGRRQCVPRLASRRGNVKLQTINVIGKRCTAPAACMTPRASSTH